MKAKYILILCVLASCQGLVKNKTADATTHKTDTIAIAPAHPPAPAATQNRHVNSKEDLIGYWVGMFEPVNYTERVSSGVGRDSEDVPKMISGGEEIFWDYANKINVVIDSINGDRVVGHSIVAGNDRPFSGAVTFKDNAYYFELSEPGDDKYDGKFSFSIKQGDTAIQGSWKANKKIDISERSYTLEKRFFKYDPSVPLEGRTFGDWTRVHNLKPDNSGPNEDEIFYDKSYFATTEDLTKYNPSAQLLTKEQVANLKKGDIFIMRNSIYARHGYTFKNQQLRAYFDREEWYMPMYKDVRADLTDIEKKNITLLMRYEKNAKEYYDVFGRG